MTINDNKQRDYNNENDKTAIKIMRMKAATRMIANDINVHALQNLINLYIQLLIYK